MHLSTSTVNVETNDREHAFRAQLASWATIRRRRGESRQARFGFRLQTASYKQQFARFLLSLTGVSSLSPLTSCAAQADGHPNRQDASSGKPSRQRITSHRMPCTPTSAKSVSAHRLKQCARRGSTRHANYGLRTPRDGSLLDAHYSSICRAILFAVSGRRIPFRCVRNLCLAYVLCLRVYFRRASSCESSDGREHNASGIRSSHRRRWYETQVHMKHSFRSARRTLDKLR